MTRNEWIAERFSVWLDRPTFKTKAEAALAIASVMVAADALEAANVAPWQSAHPLSDAAAKVVEAAVNYVVMLDGNFGSKQGLALEAAVRAYKESVK